MENIARVPQPTRSERTVAIQRHRQDPRENQDFLCLIPPDVSSLGSKTETEI